MYLENGNKKSSILKLGQGSRRRDIYTVRYTRTCSHRAERGAFLRATFCFIKSSATFGNRRRPSLYEFIDQNTKENVVIFSFR